MAFWSLLSLFEVTGAWVKAFFLRSVTVIHSACGIIIGPTASWKTLFDMDQDESIRPACTIRATASFGFDSRVQVANFQLQQFGNHNLFRVVLDGDFVVDKPHAKAPMKGDATAGTIYFPTDVPWDMEMKKVKAENTKSLRGRSFKLFFGENLDGVELLQVTFIYFQEDADNAKGYIDCFEAVLTAMAATNNCINRINSD
ncbi:unknown protein [Seminavis robusta]|uniref:Uncharacterized protein n=1 Tax=Seminavis robusta TaxID=568900 RepID=A0A9N8DK32_9STRA|nr:unknown protein [Seminavis robusta]|eukprot:Sro171_g075740.1 n/a (200) ;mRNA; r:33340-33939